jgi:nucleoside-diphosphate kinase
MQERTLTIIKPDAMKKGVAGEINSAWQKAGFSIVALKMLRLSRKQAEGFYVVHRERPFFKDLTEFMSSGPCLVAVLEAEDAILKNRKLMGATDPAKAEAGTLRKLYGASVQNNAVHGSDAPETAAFEIGYFFNALEMAH